MITWQCERCGYIHTSSGGSEYRRPRRCPVCGSARLASYTAQISEEMEKVLPSGDSSSTK